MLYENLKKNNLRLESSEADNEINRENIDKDSLNKQTRKQSEYKYLIIGLMPGDIIILTGFFFNSNRKEDIKPNP